MKMSQRESLPTPSHVRKAKQSIEMARIWVADGEQLVTLSTRVWSDPACWGLMLADLARHVAAAYQPLGHDRDETLKRIRAAFDAEWSHPTDHVEPPRKFRGFNG
jgi:hypothetical protein